MGLALNFLITILIELPIIALFFKRRKRQVAILMAFLINIISWSVAHIIFFTFDVNIFYLAVGLAIGEAIAYHLLLPCSLKKAIIISVMVNSLSFFATQRLPADLFQQKPDGLRTEMRQ